jgi:hypothetical protein
MGAPAKWTVRALADARTPLMRLYGKPPAVASGAQGLALGRRDAHIIGVTQSQDRPMTTFNDRENAFENKYAHDTEMLFRAEARRNKLVGLWAAGLLGKSGQDAADYAMTVVQADFAEPGIEDVVRKLSADLGSHATTDVIRSKMAEMMTVAKEQLASEV